MNRNNMQYALFRWYMINRYVPKRVRMEASTICQLRCTGCDFQNNNYSGLGGGFLSFDNFKSFIDENPFIRYIELSNFGEIFLNPELTEMMYYASERSVALNCRNGSNFNTVTEEQMRAMVETGFGTILVAIDGASQSTYSRYRVGGDFDTVIANVRRLQEIKREMNSFFPVLKWQYIINEHNEMEVRKAKDMAKELGIPIIFKFDRDPNYLPKNKDYIKREIGLPNYNRAELVKTRRGHAANGLCKQIFLFPQINWDGRLLGCCSREYAPFDVNVFEMGFKKALFSSKYMEAKNCLLCVHPDPDVYGECVCMNCKVRVAREEYGRMLYL